MPKDESMFTVTKSAKERICQLLAHKIEGSYMRISVQGGGCAGFQYDYAFDSSIGENDIVVAPSLVVIDSLSMEFLAGSTLDYTEKLGSAGFEIRNPIASSKCGCGASFGT